MAGTGRVLAKGSEATRLPAVGFIDWLDVCVGIIGVFYKIRLSTPSRANMLAISAPSWRKIGNASERRISL